MTINHRESVPHAIRRAHWLSFLALAVAFLATCGSVFLSVGLGLKACPLCFYQRSFAMGAFAVLLVGIFADRDRPSLHSLLAFPLAVAGLGVAAFHQYLVWTDVLQCPEGVLGLGTAPAQSLAAFAVLTAALAAAALSGPRDHRRPLVIVGAGSVGLALAWGSIISSPPLPAPPDAPYDSVKQPLEMCRPPYSGESESGVGNS
jgi:disulfide bond formation protein DsbB